MENQTEKKPASSIIPMLLLSVLAVLGFQYFFGDKDEETAQPQPEQVQPGPKPQQQPRPQVKPDDSRLADFSFPIESGEGQRITIDTGNHFAILNTKGARIERFYIKSNDDLQLPMAVIEATADPVAIAQKGIEITRGNGMDFQPHIYFKGVRSNQMGLPPLNDARFKLESQTTNSETGVTELVFKLGNLRYKGFRFELLKIYRFIKGENYFRNITALRNMETKKFVNLCADGAQVCPIYYKPFGDLGPKPAKDTDSRTIASYGRFFRYNGELVKRQNRVAKSGGGCSLLPFGCGSPDKDGTYSTFVNSSDSLEFSGTTSRYFLAYTDFQNQGATPLNRPDGFIYKNEEDLLGRDAFTTFFENFRLAPYKAGKLDLGSIDGLKKDGSYVAGSSTNQARLLETQNQHPDALIVNNKVFVGIRTSGAHDFRNADLMQAEFGSSEPNPEAHDAIYSNRFYAFFSPIQSIIVWLMRGLYGLIGNYGWCIIIIAVSFKLLTFPLNMMQARSMKKMKDLKPEMERLNQVYADNPQEKQSKLMELYKKEGVNPAKGCLPMVIQMPVFFALYSAFSESIELWSSPFIFWITDLSAPDTITTLPIMGGIALNILPLVMAVSQLLQQHFTQVTADPQQKMMMYFMPFVMLFFFWQFPSGVTLYWAIQNFISIIWQVIVNRESDAKLAKA